MEQRANILNPAGRDRPLPGRLDPPAVRSPISQARDGLGVTSRAIRHYEGLGLIRCGRDARGARTLDGAAMRDLRLIRDLRDAGVSIPEIAAILRKTQDREAAIRQILIDRLKRLEMERARIAAILMAQDG